MIVTKVAKRYASALFQEAKSRDVLDAVAGDVRSIRETVSGSRDLFLFLKSQIISRDLKKQALSDLFDEDLNDVTRQFLKLILEKRREGHLYGIVNAFEQIYKKEQGIVDVEVFIVQKPDTNQSDRLLKALENRTGKKVNLIFNEDPALKGGITVRLNDTVIDGSVKHKLQQLENSLLQPEV